MRGITWSRALSTEAALRKLDGVRSAEVVYEKGEAEVTYDPGVVAVEKMIEAIAAVGFRAEKVER